MKIDLVNLLKLNECQKCPDCTKKKRSRQLMCDWGKGVKRDKPMPCVNVSRCGSWPNWLNEMAEE